MTNAELVTLLRAGTDQLWLHRKALRRVMVRIGFWPDGLVLSARITSREDSDAPRMLSASPAPRVIPWDQLPTLTERQLLSEIDTLCAPLYEALGIARP